MLIAIEDLDLLLNPPAYPLESQYGIKQIDVNESLLNASSQVLFMYSENKNPILKIFDMNGSQVGVDFSANEIKNGLYIFNVNYLTLKLNYGLTVGNYLLRVEVDQVCDARIVEMCTPTGSDSATGGFR